MDRLILKKGVCAVNRIKEDGDHKGSSSSRMSRSRSPERRNHASTLLGPSNSQRSNTSHRTVSQIPHRYGRHEKVVEDDVREDLQKLSRGSPQGYGNGGRAQSSHWKSLERPPYIGTSYNLYRGQSQSRGGYRADGLDADGHLSEIQSGQNFDYPAFLQTLEELELEYRKAAMDCGRIRDIEEDEENFKHREAAREIRETYMKKLTVLRVTHAKQWEEFLQLDVHGRQQEAPQHISAFGFGGHKQPNYPEVHNPWGNPRYSGTSMLTDLRGRYPRAVENYPSSKPHDTCDDVQHQRRGGCSKAYGGS